MKKKLSLSTVLIAVLIICGLGLILYPTLSDMYATRQYNKEIEAYNAERTRETAERNAKLWADAEEYNRDLLNKTEQFSVSSEELTRVEGLLNPLGNGMMGYVNIPKIDVALPVYQGTDEKELQSGAGWWIGSSLPTGGESTASSPRTPGFPRRSSLPTSISSKWATGSPSRSLTARWCMRSTRSLSPSRRILSRCT